MRGEVAVLAKERGQRETCAAGTKFLPVLHLRHDTGRGKERQGAEKVEKG